MPDASAASAILLSARLSRGLTCRRGDRGTLWECWADPPAIAYLRQMAGLASPEDDPAAPGFAWHANGDWLELDSPVLGVVVRGVDTVALAEAIEDLGTFTSDATPAAVAEATRTGADFASVLPAVLLRAVTGAVARWAPGVSYAFAPDRTSSTGSGDRTADVAERLREEQSTPEVRDHRNVIPIRGPRRPG